MSVNGGVARDIADMAKSIRHVAFSSRPVGVKHFQTVHHCNVDVTHGLALLFGIRTRALPSWDPRTRRNNLWVGLAVRRRQVQADMRRSAFGANSCPTIVALLSHLPGSGASAAANDRGRQLRRP